VRRTDRGSEALRVLASFAAIAVSFALAGAPATDEPTCERECVVVVGEASLTSSVAVHLGGLELASVLGDVAPPGRKRAERETAGERLRARAIRIVVWLEAGEGSIAIRLFDVERAALFERELAAGDELATGEAIGVVVRRAVEDVIAGETEPEGMAVVPASVEPGPKPVAVAPRPVVVVAPPPHRLRVAVDYVGEAWAREQPWQSSVGFSLGWIAPFGLQIAANVRAVVPLTVRGDGAELRVKRHPVEIAIGYALRRRRLAVDATLVAIVDVLTADSRAQRPGVVARDSTRVDGGLAPRIRVGVRALDWLVFGLGFGLDIFPAAFPYAVDTGSADDTLLRPRRVRPQLQAGIAFEPALRQRRKPGR
jgi:hypothetical protein